MSSSEILAQIQGVKRTISEVEKKIVVATEDSSLGLSGRKKIQNYTVEQMAQVHISVFTEAQAKKNRNTIDG